MSRILLLQLNTERLSAVKRNIVNSIAKQLV